MKCFSLGIRLHHPYRFERTGIDALGTAAAPFGRIDLRRLVEVFLPQVAVFTLHGSGAHPMVALVGMTLRVVNNRNPFRHRSYRKWAYSPYYITTFLCKIKTARVSLRYRAVDFWWRRGRVELPVQKRSTQDMLQA